MKPVLLPIFAAVGAIGGALLLIGIVGQVSPVPLTPDYYITMGTLGAVGGLMASVALYFWADETFCSKK